MDIRYTRFDILLKIQDLFRKTEKESEVSVTLYS